MGEEQKLVDTFPRGGAVICFTTRGLQTARSAADALQRQGVSVAVWYKKKDRPDGLTDAVQHLTGSLSDWTSEQFQEKDFLIFVGATGIAVRAIAPYVRDKKTDPAVLCIDERGSYVIALLSGHIGGANMLALCTARALDAQPIITTATDINGKFAVDVFARENHLWISDMKLAKEISAALLDGEQVGFVSDLPVSGRRPAELIWPKEGRTCRYKIHIGCQVEQTPGVLTLMPKDIVLGVGCRRDKDPAEMEAFLLNILEKEQINVHRIQRVCSIDLKAQEQAILHFCAAYKLPYETFPAKQLMQVEGTFTPSAFVSSVTGVDNVCERSAVCGSLGGKLIMKKTASSGMTAAIASIDGGIRFE